MRHLPVTAALLAITPFCGAEIIYHSLNNSAQYYTPIHEWQVGETSSAVENPGGSETDARIGQVINFAGTARLVTGVTANLLTNSFGATFTLSLTIHENIAGLPGPVLWSGSLSGLQGQSSGIQVLPAEFSPGVLLPDTVIIVLEYEVAAGWGAIALGSAPIVGTRPPVMVAQDSITNQWYQHNTGPNLGLQLFVTAESGPTCYPNCDGSTVPPILNIADFTCFITRFAAGETYANCDGSTTPPTLNIADFSCFLTRFAAGCN